ERAKDREEGMSYSFDVPLSATSYDWNVQCYDDSTIPNEGVSEIRTINVQSPDTTPPATITGLTSISKSTDYVYWEWTNPIDGDFSENIVYIDSVNEINTSNSYYNATGLFDDTAYTITVHTKDTNGNVNDTDVNDTVTTLGGDTTPPVISNVRNTSVTNQTVIIEWDTDEMSNSSINYGITPALGTISETNVYTTAHVRPLSSLQANTTYYYNVTSCDPSGNCATDGPYSFKTQENIPPAPGGYLQVLSQTPDTDVTKDDFFSFSIDVKCNNGTCSNVVLTLDPWEDYNFTEEEIALAQEELNKIKKDIEDNNLDWNADLTPAFVDYVRRDRKGEIVYVEPIGEEELAGSPITQEDEKILPYYFDWRNAYGENWVTSAKNQGACSSCWAFGAVGVAEAALNIYNRWPSLMLNLSEQDIVSCSGAGDCGSGGSDNNALAYIRDTGIVNESCFPYTASDAPCGNKCADGKQYHIQDKLTIVEGADGVDKEAAIKALLKYGPSTAQINVYTDFFSYVSGIYEPSTTNTIGAHIINVIGYNETGDYFIVKNSYGTGWGMNGSGYIKSWVILNDSTIFNRLRFATGADQLNNKGVIPMNSGTPFYTITQNPYDCGNMNEGETCSVAWQVNATGFHLSDWDFFVIIESDAENSTSQNSTITIIGDYIPVIESMECESKGTWKNCSLIESGTDLTRIRVNVTDENSNIQNVGVRLKEDGIIIAEGSGAYSSGFYVYDHADKPMDSNKDYKIEVDVSDETYSINGFVSFKPTVVCIEDWQLQYDACQTNDQQLKYYIDNNACGTTNDLPADNGTYVSCNYCSEDIQGPFTTACTIFDNQTQYYTDNNYAACCAVTGLTSDCSIDNGTYDNQTLVCDCCTPNWVEVNTSCQQDDTITGYYEDSNNCYAQTGLASDNNPPANNTYTCDYCTPNLINTSWTAWTNISCLPDDTMNQTRNRTQYDSNYCGEVSNTTFVEYRATEFCDYCTHNLVNTSWSSWYDITLCQTDDTIEQERNRTQYDSNSCGEVSNQTFFEYQDIACDYCTPDWQPYNTSCQPDDTLTQCYLDSNDCYAATGLSSDNNPPANQTFSCNYANDAPVLDPISNIVVDENDLVQITPSATDIDGDTLTYSFESPLNSSGEWQTTYADSGSYDVNVTVDDGNGGIDWQLVNILVNDVLLPDLRISSSKVLTPTPAAGSWTTFQIVLENIGDVIAGNIYWILDTDSAEDNPSFGPFDLDPGKTVDIYPVVKYTSAGTYAPVFTVDYNNTIQEYDETNNEQTISLVMS
ncbi:hypothetical protein KY361_03020, partial [Candidatus Woesearchaeota archaeon]|nr:hypothetical protein [Candidatus Woesearchaeota archaeon]